MSSSLLTPDSDPNFLYHTSPCSRSVPAGFCFLVCFIYLFQLTHWKRPWCWEGLGAGGEGDDRGWDGWMAPLTWWMWVWVNSGSWWWTGRASVLQFMGWQRVRHNWATELNWLLFLSSVFLFLYSIPTHGSIQPSHSLLPEPMDGILEGFLSHRAESPCSPASLACSRLVEFKCCEEAWNRVLLFWAQPGRRSKGLAHHFVVNDVSLGSWKHLLDPLFALKTLVWQL